METAKSQDTILVLADPDDAAPVSNGDSVPESHDESHLEQTNTAEETSDVSSDITAMPLPKKLKGTEISIPRKRWLCCTWTLTWWIPTCCISRCGKMDRPEVQMAWREKVALNIIILLACGLMLFYIIGLGRIVCPKQNVLSQGEIDGKKYVDNPYVSIYGNYYKIPPIIRSHVEENQWLNKEAMESTTLGQDVSAMFFKTTVWDNYCPGFNQPSGWDNIERKVPEKAMTTWTFHDKKDSQGKARDYLAMMRFMRKGQVARDRQWIEGFLGEDPTNRFIIVAYGRVFDVSTYMAPGSKARFLGDNMQKIFSTFGSSGGDATQFLEQVKKAEGKDRWNAYMRCLDGLMYAGVIDTRDSPQCRFSNYMMLAATIVLVMIIGVKFLAALQCSPRREPEEHDKFVICAVPCYTEGIDSLQKTMDSLAVSRYDEKRKLMFIVADGIVTGGGNDAPTPELLLKVLGWEGQDPEPQAFQSLGEGMKQLNFGKVYSGLYALEGRYTPYIAVIKTGNDTETHKAGNRGKRDSQMILLEFLSRSHHKQPMSPLQLEVYHHVKNIIGFNPDFFEYLLWIDADTEIFPDSINRMVSCFINNSRIIGLCGETLIRNEGESWVTMIQVYEYFISHHLAKAFESLFGSVTCLPGCFSMYRVKSANFMDPFIIHKDLVKAYGENRIETLHMKNLLHLGEDRYLTTLMMKHFPRNRLVFSADAKALTVVPEKWSVLISQRRRWINSTLHNLFELVLLNELCGFCLFSMRFIIILDLFATMVQPAGMVYVVYLIVITLTDEERVVPLVSLIMIAAIYGLQVIIFIIKQEWQHIGWMIIYLFAMPLYAFYLPLYSFWHFDDFSWGNTRIVHGDAGQKLVALESDEEFDPSVIPLKTVEEFEDTLELPFHYHMVASYPQVAGSAVGRGSSYKGSEMRQV